MNAFGVSSLATHCYARSSISLAFNKHFQNSEYILPIKK